jgi:RHS repeat-associated protein
MIASKRPKGRMFMRALLRWLALGLLFVSAHAVAQTGGTVTYEYTDPQGTPLAEADASGNITATFDYTPYGTTALGTPPNGPGYTGHVNDPETNLVYMQARYYDPATGHFLSVDPISPAEGDAFNFNRYAYASNNPIVNIDPDGMADCAAGQNGNGGACPPPQPTQQPPQPKTLPAVTVTAARPANAYPEEIDIPVPPLALVRGVTGVGLFLMDANGVHDLIFGKQGCYGARDCSGIAYTNAPSDAKDPNGAKAPGKPGEKEGFKDPKNGEKWVKNPNGRGSGWEDSDGKVWVPTGPGGSAHGGSHWDVQDPRTGGHVNVYPGGATR